MASNRYSTLAAAQTRQLKLMKDGVSGTSIVKKDGYYHVIGAPAAKAVEPDRFGLFMEAAFVGEAALDIDPKAINEYDVGETFARTATQIRLQMGR